MKTDYKLDSWENYNYCCQTIILFAVLPSNYCLTAQTALLFSRFCCCVHTFPLLFLACLCRLLQSSSPLGDKKRQKKMYKKGNEHGGQSLHMWQVYDRQVTTSQKPICAICRAAVCIPHMKLGASRYMRPLFLVEKPLFDPKRPEKQLFFGVCTHLTGIGGWRWLVLRHVHCFLLLNQNWEVLTGGGRPFFSWC